MKFTTIWGRCVSFFSKHRGQANLRVKTMPCIFPMGNYFVKHHPTETCHFHDCGFQGYQASPALVVWQMFLEDQFSNCLVDGRLKRVKFNVEGRYNFQGPSFYVQFWRCKCGFLVYVKATIQRIGTNGIVDEIIITTKRMVFKWN